MIYEIVISNSAENDLKEIYGLLMYKLCNIEAGMCQMVDATLLKLKTELGDEISCGAEQENKKC